MKKKVLFGLVAGLALVLVGGGLFASNMGFKLNYVLEGPGTNGSKSGVNTLALPFNQQTNLVNAFDLIVDIGGTAQVAQVARLDKTTNGFAGYTGTTGAPFLLTPGEAYLVQLKVGVPQINYIVVGSHDPGRVIVFDGAGTNNSKSGQSFYAYPYHSTSANAFQLINELGGTDVVAQIAQFSRTTNGFVGYNGTVGTAFALQPGKGYLVQLKPGIPSAQFVPSHY